MLPHRLLSGCKLAPYVSLVTTDACIPHEQIPDTFKDFATQHVGGKGLTPDFYTHCRREYLHEQWKIILDDEFINAYKQGIIIPCYDGISRRFYPRIFTYSADYPEKYVESSPLNGRNSSMFPQESFSHPSEIKATLPALVV